MTDERKVQPAETGWIKDMKDDFLAGTDRLLLRDAILYVFDMDEGVGNWGDSEFDRLESILMALSPEAWEALDIWHRGQRDEEEEGEEPFVPHVVNGNYVAALQEWCQAGGIKLPRYVYKMEGEPHCPVFTAECYVLDKSSGGMGPSKKAAKQKAARDMCDMVEAL